MTTFFLASFAIRFNVFDGTLGRSLVGNLAFIGFSQIPGGILLFWSYQILAVALLAFASMTAFQDLQATAWRDVAIGEIPEIVVYRNKGGTFTRSVTAGFIAAVLIQFVVRGQTTLAVPYYGVGVFMPIMVMGLAIRQHILHTDTGASRTFGVRGAAAWPPVPGRLGLRRPDRGQVVGGRLGCADHILVVDPHGPWIAGSADGIPRPGGHLPNRSDKGPCPGRDGVHR